jgi:tripartite-type tricarboxylate transporter receptor subunit TctC
MVRQFGKNGADPVTTTSAELTKMIRTETEKYTKVVKAAGIKQQ